MTEVYICDYIRTPIGRFGGALAPALVATGALGVADPHGEVVAQLHGDHGEVEVDRMLVASVEQAVEGVVVPAVPQALHHMRKFASAIVALGMDVHALAAKIGGFRALVGGDEVPARAAVADMVERGEFAREVIRLLIGGGGGGGSSRGPR